MKRLVWLVVMLSILTICACSGTSDSNNTGDNNPLYSGNTEPAVIDGTLDGNRDLLFAQVAESIDLVLYKFLNSFMRDEFPGLGVVGAREISENNGYEIREGDCGGSLELTSRLSSGGVGSSSYYTIIAKDYCDDETSGELWNGLLSQSFTYACEEVECVQDFVFIASEWSATNENNPEDLNDDYSSFVDGRYSFAFVSPPVETAASSFEPVQPFGREMRLHMTIDKTISGEATGKLINITAVLSENDPIVAPWGQSYDVSGMVCDNVYGCLEIKTLDLIEDGCDGDCWPGVFGEGQVVRRQSPLDKIG